MTFSTLMLVSLTSSLVLLKLALLIFVVMFAAKHLITTKKSYWQTTALSWISFRPFPGKMNRNGNFS